MWNLMNKINKQNRRRLIHTENKLTGVRGGVLGSWKKKVKRLSKIKQKTPRHRQQYGDYQRKRGLGAGRR